VDSKYLWNIVLFCLGSDIALHALISVLIYPPPKNLLSLVSSTSFPFSPTAKHAAASHAKHSHLARGSDMPVPLTFIHPACTTGSYSSLLSSRVEQQWQREEQHSLLGCVDLAVEVRMKIFLSLSRR
jgi:hypothetical protein